MPPERLDTAQKPRLQLAVRENHGGWKMRACRTSRVQIRTQLRRAIIICIKNDQHGRGVLSVADRLLYRAL